MESCPKTNDHHITDAPICAIQNLMYSEDLCQKEQLVNLRILTHIVNKMKKYMVVKCRKLKNAKSHINLMFLCASTSA